MQFLSAGESHGNALVAILSGFPAGMEVDEVLFKSDLLRRRSGLGQTKRLDFESDDVQIISGLSDNITTGAPISFYLENKKGGAQFFENRVKGKGFPRPGHVDYSSYLKFGYQDISLGAERSSARETVLRVAAGSFCRMFLKHFGIEIMSEVIEIGGTKYDKFNIEESLSDLNKGSYGGVLKVSVNGSPAGLGSNVQWFSRLDAKIASLLFSIPSVKGVYIGDTDVHKKRGMEAMDHFKNKLQRTNNFAGGIEGGISNGCSIDVTLFFKPIPTQPVEFEAVSPVNGAVLQCGGGMNDLWCIDRAGVIAECGMAMVMTDVFLEKFGADSLFDIEISFKNYVERLK